VDADLACGYGACLACVVPLANGSLTRACVHGPVFDLLELAGRG
jgi:dihydroorotate dehydrogenase electron transfer subunit